MKIEIRATYAATDGRMPEDVTIEVDGIADPIPTADLLGFVMPVVNSLLTAPTTIAAPWVTPENEGNVT